MNIKHILGIIFLGAFLCLDAKVASKKQAVMECFCYCSEICAPRINDKPGDRPFVDPETGICFCQERDRVNYIKNGCHKKHNAKIFNSCCDQMNNGLIDLQPVKPQSKK